MTEKCLHHWLLGTPKDGKSKGACKLCGEEKEFSPTEPGFSNTSIDPPSGPVHTFPFREGKEITYRRGPKKGRRGWF